MSENTRKLLSSLAEDPETLERFKQDPQSVMDEFDVPEAHRKLIRDKDKKALAKEAGIDENKLQLIIL